MKFLNKLATAAAVSSLVLGATVAQADSKEPIVIPTHNWTSQITMAYVIGGIFESIGNNVSYVPADSQAVYESIRNGDVTISHEVWQSTFGKSFSNALDAGGIIDVGTHASATQEEWWYPAYVGDLCPGLPNWEALNDCAALFATADSGGKGRYLDGPMDWHLRLKTTALWSCLTGRLTSPMLVQVVASLNFLRIVMAVNYQMAVTASVDLHQQAG